MSKLLPIVPLLNVSGCLLGSIQHGLHDRQATELSKHLLVETKRIRPLAVILDFSAIPIIDSFLSRILLDTVISIKLLGSHLLMCGLPNPVIISMVELGIVVPVGTAVRDVDSAIKFVYGK